MTGLISSHDEPSSSSSHQPSPLPSLIGHRFIDSLSKSMAALLTRLIHLLHYIICLQASRYTSLHFCVVCFVTLIGSITSLFGLLHTACSRHSDCALILPLPPLKHHQIGELGTELVPSYAYPVYKANRHALITNSVRKSRT